MRGPSSWRVAAVGGVGLLVLVAVGWVAAGRLARDEAPAVPAPLPALDRDEVALGRQVYLANCAACHGANAAGAANWTQPDARGNLPPPPHDDTGHTWRHGDVELARIIRNGLRDPFNQTPELTMPPFEGRLSDAEIAAVIEYFKSLWSPEQRRYQEEQNRRPPMGTPEGGR